MYIVRCRADDKSAERQAETASRQIDAAKMAPALLKRMIAALPGTAVTVGEADDDGDVAGAVGTTIGLVLKPPSSIMVPKMAVLLAPSAEAAGARGVEKSDVLQPCGAAAPACHVSKERDDGADEGRGEEVEDLRVAASPFVGV